MLTFFNINKNNGQYKIEIPLFETLKKIKNYYHGITFYKKKLFLLCKYMIFIGNLLK